MKRRAAMLATGLSLLWLASAPAQQVAPAKAGAGKPAAAATSTPTPAQTPVYHFVENSNVVLVNVVAHDRDGKLVSDLKASDFKVYENGKLQTIDSLDLENVSEAAALPVVTAADTGGPAGAIVQGAPPPAAPKAEAAAPTPEITDQQYRDRRLIVLYLDLTTMQPEDVQSAVQSAQDFVKKKMGPADLVAIASLGNSLEVDQDFTADKDLLNKDLEAMNPLAGVGEDTGDGTTEGTPDDASSFQADYTESNIASADESLEAVQSLCDMLAPIQQKKSVLAFTSGIQRSGVDNEITLRSAVNSCVKGNSSLYTVDARGLQAMVPGGSANTASLRGTSAYTGAANLNALNAQFSQQETLATLANDTGGQAFLDSNDFAPAYNKIIQDTQSYYVIAYHSTDRAQDGKYRKILVTVDRPGIKLNFRPGYYAGKDFSHLNSSDRQAQLQDELDSPTPEESLNLYATDGYLRLNPHQYWVPVAVAIPGGEIPLSGVNKNAVPSVELIGVVRDQLGRQIDHVDATLRLTPQVTASGKLANTNVQYETGFLLSPGQKYNIRFAARENQTGQMGAFETVVQVPDLDAVETKDPSSVEMSSVLVGNQLAPTRPNPDNPLSSSGEALVTSVTHVFAVGQHMYMYYEVYNAKENSAGDIDLRTNVAFYRGRIREFETTIATSQHITDPRRKTAVVQLDIPLTELKPGYYTVQVNVMDEAAQHYAFPRLPILLRGPAPAATSPEP